jgi:hypothetical protein
MNTTTNNLQNLAKRDAHRLAQKVSLLAMASLVLVWQWSSKLIDLATPDEVMATLLMGLLAYLVARRAAHAMLAATGHADDELMSIFLLDDAHPTDSHNPAHCG